jgi:outer membrane protein OmpA-like peptidoglycan-associated protein
MRLFCLLVLALFVFCSKKELKHPPIHSDIGYNSPIEGSPEPIRRTPIARPVPPASKTITVSTADTVWFGYNSAKLTPAAQARLKKIALTLQGTITLYGGCSPEGSIAYNDILGMKRAQSVKAFLLHRVNGFVDFTCQSYGKTHLTGDYSKDRRCEIVSHGVIQTL